MRSRRRHRKVSCWRHPLIVFTLSFVVLGSLRFRTRTKRVAKRIIFRKRMEYPRIAESLASGPQKWQKFGAVKNSQPLTVAEWLALDPKISLPPLIERVRSCPYDAVYFEMPGVTETSIKGTAMEFVLVDAPELSNFGATPNPKSFADQFQKCDSSQKACQFASLGGDAQLIAPLPPASPQPHYGHFKALADAKAVADAKVLQETLTLALQAYQSKLSSKKVWFSTSGMGVAWLHFRLDDRPKYYTFVPYKQS